MASKAIESESLVSIRWVQHLEWQLYFGQVHEEELQK
jgi:hypothetical protein